jgi:hypothetical protein
MLYSEIIAVCSQINKQRLFPFIELNTSGVSSFIPGGKGAELGVKTNPI